MTTIATATEVASGQMKAVDLQGTRVAIANVDGRFYAFGDACTHEGCSLSTGKLEGMAVVCPCHGSRFDIASGNVLGGPATRRVRTYHIQVEDNALSI